MQQRHNNILVVVTSDMWHARMGHPSSLVLRHLNFVPKFDDKDTCRTCHLAKQTRSAFHSSSSYTHAIFDLIHVDV